MQILGCDNRLFLSGFYQWHLFIAVLFLRLFLCQFLLLFGFFLRRLQFFFGEYTVANCQWCEISQGENGFHLHHIVQVKRFPDIVGREEQFGLGVVDNMGDIAGLEVLQNRYDYSTVSNDSHVGHRPMGTIAANEGDSVVFLNAALLEQNVQVRHLSRYIAVSINFLLPVVGHCGAVPVHAHGVFEKTDQITSYHKCRTKLFNRPDTVHHKHTLSAPWQRGEEALIVQFYLFAGAVHQ